jgi:hypothetical protein
VLHSEGFRDKTNESLLLLGWLRQGTPEAIHGWAVNKILPRRKRKG